MSPFTKVEGVSVSLISFHDRRHTTTATRARLFELERPAGGSWGDWERCSEHIRCSADG